MVSVAFQSQLTFISENICNTDRSQHGKDGVSTTTREKTAIHSSFGLKFSCRLEPDEAHAGKRLASTLALALDGFPRARHRSLAFLVDVVT